MFLSFLLFLFVPSIWFLSSTKSNMLPFLFSAVFIFAVFFLYPLQLFVYCSILAHFYFFCFFYFLCLLFIYFLFLSWFVSFVMFYSFLFICLCFFYIQLPLKSSPPFSSFFLFNCLQLRRVHCTPTFRSFCHVHSFAPELQ